MNEAVIVALGRSAIGKASRGTLRYSRPEDIGAQVLKGVLDKIPQLDHKDIDDVIIGCAFPEAEQGMNMAKVIASRAGIPYDVPGQTVNRFCSSGLQSIASAANAIMAGQAEIIVAGGVEIMSAIPLGGNILSPNPYLIDIGSNDYTSMGITAENVADRYNVTREMQDEFAVESNMKAYKAQKDNKFTEEIIPVDAVFTYTDDNGLLQSKFKKFDQDEGIRPETTMETLGKLRTVFKVGGSVTAGNSSQTSDGAAMVVLMSREKAESLGIKPIAKFISFAVAGVPADIMGIGPIKAIPKALEIAKLEKDDIDLIELNEAFASQAVAVINELELNKEKVNVNGGAIALGHPLGCTGSFLTVKLINELKRQGKKKGIVSMCIGGGMGAAAVFEIL